MEIDHVWGSEAHKALVGLPGCTQRAERRATPLVRGGATNRGSWLKNVVNPYSQLFMQYTSHRNFRRCAQLGIL